MKRSVIIIALILTVAGGIYIWWDRRPVYAFPMGQIEAYKLEGDRIGYAGAAERLQDWPILQHRGIDDLTQAKVRTAIAERRNYFVPGNRGYLCFNPRLAFRVGENEDAVDVLICLECRWVYFYRVRDGKKARDPLCISDAGLRAFGEMDALAFPKSATTTTSPMR